MQVKIAKYASSVLVKIIEDPLHLGLAPQGSVDLRVKASSVSAHAKDKQKNCGLCSNLRGDRNSLDRREQDAQATTQRGQQKDARTTTQTVAEDTGRHQQILKTSLHPKSLLPSGGSYTASVFRLTNHSHVQPCSCLSIALPSGCCSAAQLNKGNPCWVNQAMKCLAYHLSGLHLSNRTTMETPNFSGLHCPSQKSYWQEAMQLFNTRTPSQHHCQPSEHLMNRYEQHMPTRPNVGTFRGSFGLFSLDAVRPESCSANSQTVLANQKRETCVTCFCHQSQKLGCAC